MLGMQGNAPVTSMLYTRECKPRTMGKRRTGIAPNLKSRVINMVSILTFIKIRMLPALLGAFFMLPAFGQEATMPGEENQWFAYRWKHYKEPDEADKEEERLKTLGLKNVGTWIKPWLSGKDDAMSLIVMIGPFSNEQSAKQAANEANRKDTNSKHLVSFDAGYYPGLINRSQSRAKTIYHAAVGPYSSLDSAIKAADLIKTKGIDAYYLGVSGLFDEKGEFHWVVKGRGFLVERNAASIIVRLKSIGLENLLLIPIDWKLIDKMEGGRVAYQSKTMGRSRKGDGAYGLDYQQQQWESCVSSNGGYTGGNYNTGKADWKCGRSPLSK